MGRGSLHVPCRNAHRACFGHREGHGRGHGDRDDRDGLAGRALALHGEAGLDEGPTPADQLARPEELKAAGGPRALEAELGRRGGDLGREAGPAASRGGLRASPMGPSPSPEGHSMRPLHRKTRRRDCGCRTLGARCPVAQGWR